jgi:hypothetical protein
VKFVLCRIVSRPNESISEDESRFLGENSSYGIAEHVHSELLHHLDIQHHSSAASRYNELMAEINTSVIFIYVSHIITTMFVVIVDVTNNKTAQEIRCGIAVTDIYICLNRTIIVAVMLLFHSFNVKRVYAYL